MAILKDHFEVASVISSDGSSGFVRGEKNPHLVWLASNPKYLACKSLPPGYYHLASCKNTM
jgi:hypothetical protein